MLQHSDRESTVAEAHGDLLVVRRTLDADVRILAVNFGSAARPVPALDTDAGDLLPVLATADAALRENALPSGSAVLLAGRTRAVADAVRSPQAARA